MARRILGGIALVIIALAAVVLVRTLLLSHELAGGETVDRHAFDADRAVARLATALTYPTISHQAPEDFDAGAFEGFLAFLEEAYPRIYAEVSVKLAGGYTKLYRWESSNPGLNSRMLIGHYDVVPVEPGTEDDGSYEPFGDEIAAAFLWGRGALDDKAGVLSALEAVAYVLETGFAPARALYIAAHHDQEVGRLGGAAQVMEDIDAPLAIGGAEKGFLNLALHIP
ncbi:MAG: M20/M25/M40 family metallo-hydrolase [Bacteroidetes bacterium]|jgi:carboxypeptidase PM20D1|nr:M20/M25/M40 family metallo-hydrolase [Bacteroidota bacterium]